MEAAHHARDRLVGDVGERLLGEHEEGQVGGVADVEQLEVVLVGLVHGEDERGEVLDHPVAGRVADVVEHHRLVLQLGQGLEPDRLDLLQVGGDLVLPLGVDLVPVLVVVAAAAAEQLGPLGHALGRGRHRGHVQVAVEDALVDPEGGRHGEDAGVERPQGLPPALALDLVVGVEHARVVQPVLEPEPLLVQVAAVLAEQVVPVVQLLPALGPLRRRHLERAGEAVLAHGRVLSARRSVRRGLGRWRGRQPVGARDQGDHGRVDGRPAGGGLGGVVGDDQHGVAGGHVDQVDGHVRGRGGQLPDQHHPAAVQVGHLALGPDPAEDLGQQHQELPRDFLPDSIARPASCSAVPLASRAEATSWGLG